jgi:iron-sulfur cluster assembly protein
MIHLTDQAVQEIQRLMAEKGLENTMIRFGVEAGGCSGLQYSMDFDDQTTAQDHVFEHHGLKVICDEESLAYLHGLEVDFSDKLMGGGFKFHNPQAVRSCGCGTSFRI